MTHLETILLMAVFACKIQNLSLSLASIAFRPMIKLETLDSLGRIMGYFISAGSLALPRRPPTRMQQLIL
jgi:hypothetical protein